MKELPQKLDIKAVEQKWQQKWAEDKIYAFDESLPRAANFVIDTPPPTVSGSLHMGHIFSYTQADFVARFQRMSGKNVFYPMGFDDNGLPTERLVEKTLKIRATDFSREEFIAKCQGVAEQARKDFRDLFTSTALSVDWAQEYHTISDEVVKLSQMSFLDLIKKGHAYRQLQPMFWDPVDQTAIANAEVEEKEQDSFENYIYFGLIDENADPKTAKWEELEKVEIMTTRPELLAACVALMCHPDDAAKFAGKKAVTPLFNVIVPIVADDKVAKDKGTGLVMCCTFGDETDIFWWKKYNLPARVILNKFGKVDFAELYKNGCAVDAKDCLADYEKVAPFYDAINNKKADHQEEKLSAKKTMIKLLEENNLTAREKKPIKHAVKCAERSGAALEFIPTTQWFIKVVDKKEELKKKAAECNWHPEYMYKRVEQWIDSLSWDWCISRQRYFGVPFPVWYARKIKEIIIEKTEKFEIEIPVYDEAHIPEIIYADIKELPSNPLTNPPRYSDFKIEYDSFGGQEKNIVSGEKVWVQYYNATKNGEKYHIYPEQDVMDTWATSSISPQISSKAITKEFAVDYERHQKLFPADLRPQAHEIIRTWAFYTIVKAYLHEDQIPWHNLMISGWCLAADKSKMSKSKGNVITPQSLIAEKGADSVRYWSSTSRLGSDTAFSEDVLKIGNKLVNKLWNATKFAAIHFNKIATKPTTAANDLASGIICEPIDKWIISRLQKTITKATAQFETFEYCDARVAVEDFFWNDFCDNYLEIVKVRVYDEAGVNPKGQQSAASTIYYCLNAILKLFAPFTPHICDELYEHIFDEEFAQTKSIHAKGNWPLAANYFYEPQAEKAGILTREILDAVRKTKAEANVSVKFPVESITIAVDEASKELLPMIEADLKNVTSAEKIIIEANSGEKLPSFDVKVAVKLGAAAQAA
jgi:valyl-tRNA synthetase